MSGKHILLPGTYCGVFRKKATCFSFIWLGPVLTSGALGCATDGAYLPRRIVEGAHLASPHHRGRSEDIELAACLAFEDARWVSEGAFL